MVTYQPYWGYPRDLSAYNSPFKNLGVSSLDAGILGYSGGGNLINYVFKDDRIIGLDVRTGYVSIFFLVSPLRHNMLDKIMFLEM